MVFIASALAGVSTGLVGLSAATVMVPIMIVLCPTFQSGHGAFMAAAIALASDILASAVTTYIYAKNKNIDLKRGKIMLICIIGMCAVGSVAAYFAHQAVLGGSSLFLCVAIGIRFLVKPDSGNKEGKVKDAPLNAKQIAISLFFGIVIGFGTGFFGSGGGMMMLVIFTLCLGFDRKTAVGTSTLIITFTALIASVSHIFMKPEIILQQWDFLLIAIVTATFFSVYSARFANKVDEKLVGTVTGAILLVLGMILICLNYREYISKAYINEFLRVSGIFLVYIIAFAAPLIILRYTVKIKDHIFRKMLHMVAVCSVFPLVMVADTWQVSLAVDAVFLIIVYVALKFVEEMSFYDSLFVQKKKHEVINSFMGMFGVMALLIIICPGILGEEKKFLAVMSIMAWGPGDAMAAIVGIGYGKHHITGRFIEGTKSVEGTVSMAVTSFVCTAATLIFLSPFSTGKIILSSLIISVISAFTELNTKGGWDTVTVPLAALMVGVLL